MFSFKSEKNKGNQKVQGNQRYTKHEQLSHGLWKKKKKKKCGLILNNLWCVRRIHLTFLVRKFYFTGISVVFLNQQTIKCNQNIAMNDIYVAIIMQLLFILFNHWNQPMDEE